MELKEEKLNRPGGFALTHRLLRWYREGEPRREYRRYFLERSGELQTGLPKTKTVLIDVGCGTGETLHYIRSEFPDWVLHGIDPAVKEPTYPEGVEDEAENGEIHWHRGVAEDLPFPDRSADIILMECSYSRFADPKRALKEALRVLKPTGDILMGDLYVKNPQGVRRMEGEEDALSPCSIGRLETADQIRTDLEACGLHPTRMKDVSRVLGGWLASRLMEGGTERVSQCIGMDPKELRRRKVGYYLLQAIPSPLPEVQEHLRKNSRFYSDVEVSYTTAEDLRREPESFLCVSPREVARIITLKSSGSEGAPKRIFFTEQDLGRTADFFQWGIRAMVKPGDKVAVFMEGPTHYSVGGLLQDGLSRLPAEVSVFGFVNDTALAAEQAKGMDSIIGVPSQIYRLAKEYPGLQPRTVLLSADYVPESVIRWIEKIWNCQVYTHWGMSETGYGGGVQCKAREGYHIREEDLMLTIIDPVTGEVMPEGEEGELVITTLSRRAMPLLHYRTGDRGRLITGPCSCGSLLPRLAKVTGRIRGDIVLPDGRILNLPELDEIVYALPILAYKGNWISKENTLEIHLLPEPGVEAALLHNMETKLRDDLEMNFGTSFTLSIDEIYEGEGRGKRRLLDQES